jgi:hypothetical protein
MYQQGHRPAGHWAGRARDAACSSYPAESHAWQWDTIAVVYRVVCWERDGANCSSLQLVQGFQHSQQQECLRHRCDAALDASCPCDMTLSSHDLLGAGNLDPHRHNVLLSCFEHCVWILQRRLLSLTHCHTNVFRPKLLYHSCVDFPACKLSYNSFSHREFGGKHFNCHRMKHNQA